jgi:hypothetical protein
MGEMESLSKNATALDQLERENRELRRIFVELDAHRSTSVEDRAEYGKLVKKLIRHVAIRESALVDVGLAIEHAPSLPTKAEKLRQGTEQRRTLIDRVEKMSRGVQGINLNTGQNFDAELLELQRLLQNEMQWEAEAVPGIRAALRGNGGLQDLHSADYVVKHAPTNLSPRGPRWYERAPFVSRLLTLYDHLRDFPKAARSG